MGHTCAAQWFRAIMASKQKGERLGRPEHGRGLTRLQWHDGNEEANVKRETSVVKLSQMGPDHKVPPDKMFLTEFIDGCYFELEVVVLLTQAKASPSPCAPILGHQIVGMSLSPSIEDDRRSKPSWPCRRPCLGLRTCPLLSRRRCASRPQPRGP